MQQNSLPKSTKISPKGQNDKNHMNPNMPKEFRYIFNKWEDELLNIAHEAIECAIASAYLSQEGVDLLEKVAKRLAEFSTDGAETIIKVILSDRFAPTKRERLQILKKLSMLPGVVSKIYHGKEFQHRKNFIFRGNNEIRVMVGSVNVTSAGFFKNLELATLIIHEDEDSEATRIISEFGSMWEKSKLINKYLEAEDMLEIDPLFKVGENVKYVTTGQIGTINKVIEQTRGYSYKVMLDRKVRTIPERFLEPFADVEDDLVEKFISGDTGSYQDYRLFQTWFRLTRPLENNLYSYLSSKTIFNAHQFKPLLRFLSPTSEERLFIADEVGLGKTIETGIILTEMLSRDRLDNRTPILIICPNSLGPKWAKEMRERFQLDFHIHDGNTLKYTLTTTLQDGRLPPKYNHSIASLQLTRMEDHLNALKEIDSRRELPLFGMVIVDEAHHMRNTGTDSNDLGNVLSGMTDMMLMLSATPLNLKNEDLFNQMHIINPALFPDWRTFEALQSPVVMLNQIRRHISANTLESRREILERLEELKFIPLGNVILSYPGVQSFLKRLENPALFTMEEIVGYEHFFVTLSPLYSSFTRTRKREALEHQVQREALEVPITLSEREMKFHNDVIAAIEEHYLSRGGDPRALAFVTNTHRRMISSCIPAMREYLQWCISKNKIQMVDEASLESEDDGEAKYIELSPWLREEFKRLLDEAKEIESIDSKYEGFKRIIEKTIANPETPQVIVFSFFIRTLEYLKHRLENEGICVGIIHGKISVKGNGKEQDRYDIMENFKQGKYEVLLSSEVGGEGLDFQYCHAIVNYDLPYNPMRVEQRIGRIDRFGQQADKVIVANLFIKGTVDEEIYDRLYRRIRLVEDGVGALEPILGNEIANLQNMIVTGQLTEEQKEERSKRLKQSIESARQQMEEFEKHRAELLSDDYLAKPINKLSESNFIGPEDETQLTKEFLDNRKGCRFTKTGEGLGEIVLSENTVSLLERFLKKPKNEGGYGVLQPLLTANEGVKVVFDGTIADANPDHLFLPPTGFWTRFITYQLQQEQKIYQIFRFGAKSSEIELPKGEYIVSLFEVQIEGIRTEIEFLGVPVEISSSSVIETNLENLPRVLGVISCFEIESKPDDIDVDYILDYAREYLANLLEARRAKAAEENQFKIDSRIAALKRASEARINTMEQTLDRHIEKRKNEGLDPSEKFIRLTKARMETEKTRLESKIEGLRNQKELSMDYNLKGIVYLKVM